MAQTIARTPSNRRGAPGATLRARRLLVVWALALVPLVACGDDEGDDTGATGREGSEPDTPPAGGGAEPERVPGITTTEAFEDGEGLDRWFDEVPDVEDVAIPSSEDGEDQPALWVPASDEGAPLLVVLHSWSNGYDQHIGIPMAQWAQANDWAMIHPDYRGVFERPEATGSDLAVADVLDAIDHAVEEGSVDEDRVFVTGYSGGAMMSLLMAGRHADRFAGVAAWVPIHDLVDWYEYNVPLDTDYVGQIEASCGGDPSTDTAARDDCLARSPASHLDGARDAEVPIYIAAGVDDDVVPASDAVNSFNALAAEGDQLPPDVLDDPTGAGEGTASFETYFTDDEPDVLLATASGPVSLVLFDGGHEMVFHPALEWMADLAS